MSAPIPPSDIPDWQDYFDAAVTAALTRTDQIDSKSFTDGNLWNIIAGVAAALGEEDAQIALQLFLKTFFATASGDDLDALAGDHLNLLRIPGVQARAIVRFSRVAQGENIEILVGTLLATADGIQFATENTVTLVGTEVEVPATALLVGAQANVDPDTIVIINSSLADPSINVTNPDVAAGGNVAETDSKFRERILAYYQTLRRGTLLALETGALFVAGVVEATADDSSFPPTVFIADASGGANQLLIDAVIDEMINWRAAGIPVNVIGATVVQISIGLTILFRTGFDVLSVREAVVDAVVAEVNSSDIGEILYHSEIIGAAQAVEGVHSVEVTNPPGALVPEIFEVIRTAERSIIIS